jgi:hypothetical protein
VKSAVIVPESANPAMTMVMAAPMLRTVAFGPDDRERADPDEGDGDVEHAGEQDHPGLVPPE